MMSMCTKVMLVLAVVATLVLADPSFRRERPARCYPKVQYVTHYETKYQQVPVYKTVYKKQIVPKTFYQTVYKTEYETSYHTDYVPKYIDHTVYKTEVVPEYHTVVHTQQTYKTVCPKPDYGYGY
ncbi:uncharacterized protein [Panulirus ornatus]|uniref:uncharacterized protein n=1 Tax=Panulirus ornatus TaxID=150431 RepID=UPI003A897824